MILIYTARFGPPSPELRAAIEANADADALTELVSLFSTADESELQSAL